jgi:hypothetical protein
MAKREPAGNMTRGAPSGLFPAAERPQHLICPCHEIYSIRISAESRGRIFDELTTRRLPTSATGDTAPVKNPAHGASFDSNDEDVHRSLGSNIRTAERRAG